MIRLTRSATTLAILFTISGMSHFLFHGFFLRMVPAWVPYPAAIVSVTGVLELLGAVGLIIPATRELAGWCLIALCIAVFPANIQMLTNARAAHSSALVESLLWLRLPLQPLLIFVIYRYVTVPSRRARTSKALTAAAVAR